uniref:Arm DNA-binding domain-containing protein n=1 Tax=Hydrogenophaga sp. TaxID=1904254 RepID=UPI00356AB824
MPLTDTAIKKLKPAEKPVKVTDERGLYLLVNPTGSKLWRWKYRFEGKEKVMPFGQYPDISLAQARNAREDARKLLATGADPMALRKTQKVARQLAVANSFAEVARLWWANWKAARSDSHVLYVMRRLE